MSRALHLAEQLIARRSVTPDDGGCQSLIADWLAPLGFECRTLTSGPVGAQVTNLWAVRPGASAAAPRLAFADSPTNLMWRLQNDMAPPSRLLPKVDDAEEGATFTEIMFDAPRE